MLRFRVRQSLKLVLGGRFGRCWKKGKGAFLINIPVFFPAVLLLSSEGVFWISAVFKLASLQGAVVLPDKPWLFDGWKHNHQIRP